MKSKFIRTFDEKTKDKLISQGFVLVSDSNGWLFVNKDGNYNFDKMKVIFSNILFT